MSLRCFIPAMTAVLMLAIYPGCGNGAAAARDTEAGSEPADGGRDAGGTDDAGRIDAGYDPYPGAFGIYAAFTDEFMEFATAMGFDSLTEYQDWAGDLMKDMGATWTRSNLQLIWDLVEPVVGGGFDWTASRGGDDVFAGAARHGVQYLAVFHEGGGPTQMPGRPQSRNPLDDLPGYLHFVQAAVERYDGDGFDDAPSGITVKFWQLGNEIGDWTGSGRDASDYAQWVSAAAGAIRAADPEARVVLIASTDASRLDPLHREAIETLAAGGVKFDAVDLHHWGDASLHGSRMLGVPEYRALLAQHGLDNVELWSCEHGTYVGDPDEYTIGVPCNPSCPSDKVCGGGAGCVPRCTGGAPCPPDMPQCNETTDLCAPGVPSQTHADQARSLVYRYVVNRALGIRRIMWGPLAPWRCLAGICGGMFDLMGLVADGRGPGETPADVGKRRPAFFSHKMLAERTDDTAAGQLGEVDTGVPGLHVYAYRNRARGKTGLVVWADQSMEAALDFTGVEAQVTGLIADWDGNPLRSETVSAEGGKVSIQLDGDPVWVE